MKRYIEALKLAHRKEIDGLLTQARDQARQIAELRIEAGQAAAMRPAKPAAESRAGQTTEVSPGLVTQQAAGQGTANSNEPAAEPSPGQGTGQPKRQPAQQAVVLKVEDIVPLSPPPPAALHAPLAPPTPLAQPSTARLAG